MTITFCLVPFNPLAVRSEPSGFNLFPYSILKYENRLSDMKYYSCSPPISYNAAILIHYFQNQRSNHTILKFLILRGVGFEMCRVFRTSHIICK